jgi:hypothetical protein
MTGNASAFSPAPSPEPKSDVILVLGGCGPGFYPNVYGQCVPRAYCGGATMAASTVAASTVAASIVAALFVAASIAAALFVVAVPDFMAVVPGFMPVVADFAAAAEGDPTSA